MITSIIQSSETVELKINDSETISFKGYFFETRNSPLNKKIDYLMDSSTVGIRALFEINKNKELHEDYNQMLLIMAGSNAETKCELIVAYRKEDYHNLDKLRNMVQLPTWSR
jgi:hypothetical protein